jgi:hypothetical protein
MPSTDAPDMPHTHTYMPTTCSGFWNPDGCNLVHPSIREKSVSPLLPSFGWKIIDLFLRRSHAVFEESSTLSRCVGNGWLPSTPRRRSHAGFIYPTPKHPSRRVGNGWLLFTPRQRSHVGVHLSNPRSSSRVGHKAWAFTTWAVLEDLDCNGKK